MSWLNPTHGLRVRLACCCSALPILLSSPVVAQAVGAVPAASEQSAPSNATQASDRSTDAAGTGEVVVTARRRAERLLDVPVAATAVGAAELKQYNVTSLTNIQVAVPQISFDRIASGGSASIALRGVSSSPADAGLEQSVLIDYDGLPTARGRIVADGMFDIATVDVLKGPQSLYFGKNSPGGVVSIKSADPGQHAEGYLRAGYEFTARQKNVEGAFGGPLTDTLGARIAFIAQSSKGYLINRDTTGVTDPFRTARLPADYGGTFDPPAKGRLGGEDRYGGRLTLRYDNGRQDATFKMLGTYYRGDGTFTLQEVMGCPAGQAVPITVNAPDALSDCRLDNHVSIGLPPQKTLDAWPAVAAHNGGLPYSRNVTLLPTLTVNDKIGKLTLTSITSLFHYDFVNQGNAGNSEYSYFYVSNNEVNTSFVQEVRAVTSFAGAFNFSGGGYYSHDNRTLRNGSLTLTPVDPATGRYELYDEVARNRSDAFSVFGAVSIKPVANVELSGGARYTRETKHVELSDEYRHPTATTLLPAGIVIAGARTESNVSPEATLTWHPQRDVMLYVAYKTGYLAGGFSNPGNLAATVTIAGDVFGEEKAHGVEGGTKFSLFGRTLTGSLIGYHYIYEGLQLTSFDGQFNPPLIHIQNAANSVFQGGEFELSYHATRQLTLRGSAAYNDAHFNQFPGSQCYARQTAAQGCVNGVQDLSGRPIYRAPKWILTAGTVFNTDLGGDYGLQLNADLRHSSGYFALLTLNPLGYQRAYTVVNAGARLTFPGNRWSLAVVGRNLTNRIYATVAQDKVSGVGEVVGVAAEQRAVVLQAEVKF